MSGSENKDIAPASNAARKMSKRTAIIAAVIVTGILVAAPLTYLVLTNEDETGPAEEEPITVKVTGKDSTIEYELSDLEAMQYLEQYSSYQNRFGNWRGDGIYRGVELRALAGDVGGMVPGDIMTIEAGDGYLQNLSYYQVYADSAYKAVQGSIILAYAFNGTNASGWTDGPMIAVLAPDQAFSNEDFNQTADRDPEFAASTSAGSLWVKNVKNITISSVYTEWTLNIKNLEDTTSALNRTQFVSLDYWHGSSYVDSIGRNWTGVPISNILGVVDDSDPSTFNRTLADTRYRVTVTGSDGTNSTMVAADLVDSGVILANKMNGSLLSSGDAPLRILGPGMAESYQVANITAIAMIGPDTILLTVNGTVQMNYSMTDLEYMQAITEVGGFRKSTGTVVGPDTYTGVSLRTLVERVYTGDDFSLRVVAADDYAETYSSAQVMNGTFAHYNDAGVLEGPDNFTMIIAYLINGNPLAETLRVAIVDPTAPITDGEFWVKYVRYIEVVPFVKDWNITLEGLSNMTMSRQNFESVATCSHHRTSYTLTNSSGTFVYEGVPLWTLLAAVDGADEPDGHYLFNDMIATAGYNVTIVDSFGVNTTFNSSEVAHNAGMIVANLVNGQILQDDEWPLRLVGDGLTEEQMARCIARIVITNISSDYPMWNLTMVGLKNVTIDSCTFDAFFRCGIHSVWYNYSSGGVDHSYAGIPLWILISAIDGDDDIGHYVFNTTLAALGYRVNVSASDGFNKTFNMTDVMFNDGFILAYTLDGEYLTGTNFPLRLVGTEVTSSLSVKAVVKIELEEPLP